jgi:hypothetical protein
MSHILKRLKCHGKLTMNTYWLKKKRFGRPVYPHARNPDSIPRRSDVLSHDGLYRSHLAQE